MKYNNASLCLRFPILLYAVTKQKCSLVKRNKSRPVGGSAVNHRV